MLHLYPVVRGGSKRDGVRLPTGAGANVGRKGERAAGEGARERR